MKNGIENNKNYLVSGKLLIELYEAIEIPNTFNDDYHFGLKLGAILNRIAFNLVKLNEIKLINVEED